MEQRNFITSWNEIHTIIDDAMEKRDRSVAIYFSPENGMSVNVYPWPDYEDLYNMYCEGKITFNDFRSKAGLPRIKTEKAFKDRNEVIEKMRNDGNKSLDDLKKELGVVSPSKVSDKSDDGILVGALDIYTIDLNDEDLKKISAGEEIELNMDVDGEDKILRSISICIKKEPVKEG